MGAITNPELISSTIAQTLEVKETGGKPILEALKNYLREKQMLIVADNFEQVIDAASNISELLAAASNLKFLITSRELLHLSAEREFVVPPLAVPDEISNISLGELSNYEAIKLFVERARNSKPNFALTEENADDIVEICARLDGLPLAIELAAARIKILSPNMVLAKLENSLKLLTGGATDLPARQQTMRGAVEWSYELLNVDEKTLFRRLAVFAGGFTFEAAEAVCNNYELSQDPRPKTGDQSEILELITSLVDKSLLVAKDQAGGEQRFRMLEVVREYVLECLEKNDEAEEMRRRYANYFLALGEEAGPHLTSAESVKWLNRLEEEHDNLRDTLAWLLENDAEMAARLAAALWAFWSNYSHLTEGRKWLKASLERGSLDAPVVVRFKLLNALGWVVLKQGDFLTAQKLYEEGLAAGRAANDLLQIARSNSGLGAVAYVQGNFTAARKFEEKGLGIYRELNNNYGIAASLNNLGELWRNEGDNAAARPLLEESLAIRRQIGNKAGVCDTLNNLGSIAYGESDFVAARTHYTEALATAQVLGAKITLSFSLDGFAALAVEGEELELAAQIAGATEHLREQIGFKIEPADQRFREFYFAELKTKMDEVAFAKYYEQGRKLKLEQAVALCLNFQKDENITENDTIKSDKGSSAFEHHKNIED